MIACCGDVKITPTDDGGALVFVAGQPEMDAGLGTAVYLSLYTSRGWWADPDLGSDLESLEARPLTNQTRLDVIEAARLALVWLVDEGIASAVDVSAEIIAPSVLALIVRVTEPTGTATAFRYRINWLAMQEAR